MAWVRPRRSRAGQEGGVAGKSGGTGGTSLPGVGPAALGGGDTGLAGGGAERGEGLLPSMPPLSQHIWDGPRGIAYPRLPVQ